MATKSTTMTSKKAKSTANTLHGIFAVLKTTLEAHACTLSADKKEVIIHCLSQCENGLKALDSRRKKLSSRGKLVYPFRKQTLDVLHREVNDLLRGLVAVINIAELDLGAATNTIVRNLLNNSNKIVAATSRIEIASSELRNTIDSVSTDARHNRLISENLVVSVAKTISSADNTRAKSILEWLNPVDVTLIHAAARRKHVSQTGQWLLQSDTYQHWVRHGDRSVVLWLHGKAGCGKTILCSSVIEDVKQRCESDDTSAYAYHYFSFSEQTEHSYLSILRSLVGQLCLSRGDVTDLEKAFEKYAPNHAPEFVLESIIVSKIQKTKTTFIILDALDECPDLIRRPEREQVLEWFQRLHDEELSGLKILVSSRKENDIAETMDSVNAVFVEAQNSAADKDVATYITKELARPKLQKLSAGLKNHIEDVLAEKVDGMFRWAFCQVEEIKHLKSFRPSNIEAKLQDLPKDLDETYERILCSIDDIDRAEVLTALRWLAFSEEPLTIAQLTEPCIVKPGGTSYVDESERMAEDELLGILSHLVAVVSRNPKTEKTKFPALIDASRIKEFLQLQDDGQVDRHLAPSSRVKLAHYSVKEYLVSSRIAAGSTSRFYLDADISQRYIADICIRYMEFVLELSDQDDGSLCSPGFYYYAYVNWATHVQLSRQVGQIEVDWLKRKAFVQFGHLRTKSLDRFDKGSNELYSAANFGLLQLVRHLCFLNHDVNVDVEYTKYRTVLNLATSHDKRLDIMEALLHEGADPNMISPHTHMFPLSCAVHYGGKRQVQILLEAGADINAGPSEGLDTALAMSAGTGQCRDNDAMMALLDNDAAVNATSSGGYGSALAAACCRGDTTRVEILLDHGADINAGSDTAGNYGYALIAACSEGPSSILELLLSCGADVMIGPHSRAGYALTAACEASHEEAVELLVAHGADVNAGPAGRLGCALVAACAAGNLAIVQMLLFHGADPNKGPGGLFGYPLIAACYAGHDPLRDQMMEEKMSIVEMLLDHGAWVEPFGPHGVSRLCDFGTPLLTACYGGNLEKAQLLLEHGASVNTRSGRRCETPLEAARFIDRDMISHDDRMGLIMLLKSYGAEEDQSCEDSDFSGDASDDMCCDQYHEEQHNGATLTTPFSVEFAF